MYIHHCYSISLSPRALFITCKINTGIVLFSSVGKYFRMHRQPDHVMAFLLAELGTSGSLDGQQRLVVKGRFAPKNFEGILRRYVSKYISCLYINFVLDRTCNSKLFLLFHLILFSDEYVICLGCKSPDTILTKENRLFFLRCEKV